MDTVKKIVIEKRTDDYIAFLEGNRDIWGNGPTPRSAIGNLITVHGEVFGLVVIYP